METKISITVGTSVVDKLFKTYRLQDITSHAGLKYKNLMEICLMYPNRGAGFKAWHKDWPIGDFYLISDTEMVTNRKGEVYGLLFKKNKQVWSTPQMVPMAFKRSLWRVRPGDASVVLDNGMEYFPEDIAPELEKRNRVQHK